MQKLSIRLQAVADFVTPGNRIADVGTDHGYLPIYLVQQGIVPWAVAMDINEGPLARAREHIAQNGLEQYIVTRRSDGLSELKSGEADSVVMAGLGGLLTMRILEAAAPLLPEFKELVLGPQSDIALVRRYLRGHGLVIDREDLVRDAGKYYPILHVVQAQDAESQIIKEKRHKLRQALSELPGEFCQYQWLLDQYGECLILEGHPLLPELLERDERRRRNILLEMENSPQAEKNRQRIRQLTRESEEIHQFIWLAGQLR